MKNSKMTILILTFVFVIAANSFAQQQQPDEDSTIVAPSRKPRPFIGIQMTETDDATGVRVNRVIDGTPADKAGILVNDVINKIGEVEISNRTALVEAVDQYKIGDQVELSILRGEEEIAVGLTFIDSDDVLERIERQQHQPQKLTFPSKDGLEITAEIYVASSDKNTLFIVLCHQAGWSRGEYREIAPKLVTLGFNCLAIDQRSGEAVDGVANETARKAAAAKKETSFVAAEQDMLAAIKWARANHAAGKLILWGSSYSAALALRIAGEHPELVDGVMAFAPGEYFARFDKPDDWITSSAKKIKAPAFITSAKDEFPRWEAIYDAIPGETKTKFVPETKGNHGSRALWEQFDDSADYWKQAEAFLAQFK